MELYGEASSPGLSVNLLSFGYKFGVPYDDALRLYAKAAGLPGIQVAGVHMHIGSQITDLQPFRDAFALMRDLVGDLRRAGHNIGHLDIGGGLGVPYRSAGSDILPSPGAYAAVVRETLGDLGLKIVLEPGRVIVAGLGGMILCSRFMRILGRTMLFRLGR